MSKQIIAVDLDDVLASSAAGFVAYSNKIWGTNLTIEEYDEHWGEMWALDHEETKKRAHQIYESKMQGNFKKLDGAYDVLNDLAKNYSLVITTSRHRLVKDTTLEWLEKHYPGIFDEVHLAGIWDRGLHTDEAAKLTKAELCVKIGASLLIDDHPKHCIASAKAGVEALLFGDYRWNRHVKLTKGMTRVRGWTEVEEYFSGKGR